MIRFVGIVMVKLLPLPSIEVTLISPCMCSMMVLQIESPKPAPGLNESIL